MKTQPSKKRNPKGAPTAIGGGKARARYLELVRDFPLCVIRSEDQYQRAIATLDGLSDRGKSRSSDETEYLLALSVFVGRYEQDHHPLPAASGVDMFRYLIEIRGLAQADVAAGTGLADSTVSEILAGKRRLSIKHIDALRRFFKVKPALFLDE